VKPLRYRIQQTAKKFSVSQVIIERDYVQSYMLLGIAKSNELQNKIVFKGGTALKKVHLGDYRFSEDLDFSMTDGPNGEHLERAVHDMVDKAQIAAREYAPLAFSVERYVERDPHPSGQEAFVVRAQFPWQRQPMVPVKIEVTHDEPILLPTPLLPVSHGYDELFEAQVLSYSLEEISAEKLRSTRQTQAKLAERGWARSRARDFYDLWHLVQLEIGRIDWFMVAKVLPQKCEHRLVTISSVADIFSPDLLAEIRATWNRTLGPFVQKLPDVEQVISETHNRLKVLLPF